MSAIAAPEVEDEKRQRLALLHILEDLQREHDAAELARKQWLQTIDAVRDPMVVHDAAGHVLRSNLAYARKAGIGVAQLIGKPYWECFPRMEHALAGDEFATGAGEIFVARSFPIHDADGEPRSVVHIFEDVTERKRAAEALEKREKRFRALIENGSDLILVIDAKGFVSYASPSAQAISGFELHEIVGSPFVNFVHPDDVARTVANIAAIGRSPGATHSAELRLRLKNGNWADAAATSTNALHDPNILGIVVNARDVTARKRAERGVERANRLYATLSAVNHAIVHAETRRDLCERIVQLSTDIGLWHGAWIGFVDPETKRIVPQAWSPSMAAHIDGMAVSVDPQIAHGRGPTGNAARSGEPYFCDDVFADPATLPWQGFATKLGIQTVAAIPLCPAGSPAGVVNLYSKEAGIYSPEVRALVIEMGSDITFAREGFERERERLNAVRGLRESEARFRAMFDQSTVGMSQTSLDGRFVAANPALCALFGRSEAELVGRHFADLMHPDDRALSEAMKAKLGDRDETGGSMETRYLRKDGGVVWANVSVSLVRDEAGEPLHFFAMVENLSERKRAEHDLRLALSATIEAIAATVETRDPYTAGHQRRVADLAAAIAREMKLPADTVEGIHFGALIHDLGKIQVPAELLSKPTKLTKLEFELIKTHPQTGYEIVRNIKFPWKVAEMVHQHHERLDGSGYPQGLTGEAIALEARVLAVADVVEAMASHRPYRPGLGTDAALKEVAARRGTWFDPAAVDACLAIFRDGRFSFGAS